MSPWFRGPNFVYQLLRGCVWHYGILVSLRWVQNGYFEVVNRSSAEVTHPILILAWNWWVFRALIWIHTLGYSPTQDGHHRYDNWAFSFHQRLHPGEKDPTHSLQIKTNIAYSIFHRTSFKRMSPDSRGAIFKWKPFIFKTTIFQGDISSFSSWSNTYRTSGEVGTKSSTQKVFHDWLGLGTGRNTKNKTKGTNVQGN